jgi:hypothetical protein
MTVSRVLYSFRIYAEGITHGYVRGNTGLYLIRHNPFAMLSDIADNKTLAKEHIWPFKQFAIDLANHNIPEFSYIAGKMPRNLICSSSRAREGVNPGQVLHIFRKRLHQRGSYV